MKSFLALVSLSKLSISEPIILLEPFRPLCSQDSVSPMIMSTQDTSYGSYQIQFSIPSEAEYATRTIGLISDNRNQDPYYLQLNFNRGRQENIWTYVDDKKQYESVKGSASDQYIILNMRSEKGMSNLKIPHNYNLVSDFTGQFTLGIAWDAERVLIKRLGAAVDETIFDSKVQDELYQSTMTEVDFSLYDERSIEYPSPFKVTIEALPPLMKFIFTVYQNRKGEGEDMREQQLRIASYKYTPLPSVEEQQAIDDPFDNLQGW